MANDSFDKLAENLKTKGLFDNLTKSSNEQNANKPTNVIEENSFDELAVRCKELYTTLKQFVYGQDDAIRIFVQGYFQSELNSFIQFERKAPKGIFLFAGPPGVGKTYLATKAAEFLNTPMKRFDMSEYSGYHDHGKLLEQLASYVQKNPKSIVLFDEIEKANLNVIHLFLQILDNGELQGNAPSSNLSFRETILIFTTNAGKKLYEDNREQNLSLLSQAVVLDALEQEISPVTGQPVFPAAICSRFATGNVVVLNYLSSHYLLKIAEENFQRCAAAFAEEYVMTLGFDEKLASLFLFHMTSNLDARIISSQSYQFLERELYEFSRQATGIVDFVKLEHIQFSVKVPEHDEKIRKLFYKETVEHVAVMGDETLFAQADFSNELVEFHFAKDSESLQAFLLKHDIRFVIVDPLFGDQEDSASKVFSMEDYDTEGIRCLHLLQERIPSLPVYILEAGAPMREEDKNTFLQQGAQGILSCLDEEAESLEEQIHDLLIRNYLQEQVNVLSGQGKVLDYNTAQMISKDGDVATIEFYDFKLHTAVKAGNRATVLSEAKKPNVRFSDIIGAKSAKDELRFFIEYLKNPKEFMIRGVKAPKGVLLYGPPGTGKTMLAKAMAGEADVTFLPTAATDFLARFVGQGEERIRDLFRTAKQYAPSVIFIDEIDAIGKERTGASNTQYTEVLLNALLTEMDGFSFDPQKPVFVIAATNFPLDKASANGKAVIDPALLRRFANKILIDLPDEEDRKEFLLQKIQKIENCQLTDSALENVASRTTGESLANLQNILDLALRNAEKAGAPLTDATLLNAMEEYYYGEEHQWGRSYYESVAHHEAGHTYLCHLSGTKPSFVTIVSRGNFGGYMQSGSNEKTPCYTKEQLLWRIRTALAGRAAEIVFYGEEAGINTGVSGDLETATNLVLQMLCRYGMSGTSLLSLSPDVLLQSALGAQYLAEAESILQTELQNTMDIIKQGKEKVHALAEALLEKNQLTAAEIEPYFN